METSKNWQKNTENRDQIKQGSPSLEWTSGLEYRLNLIKKHVDLKDKRILDVGCGVGLFLKKFNENGAKTFGIDVDRKKIESAKNYFNDVWVSKAENMPFKRDAFDIVFLHEVIEHVDDDFKTIKECFRVLRSGGYLMIFAPNRLWPFETHGIYYRNKYHFGNKFLIPYLPDKIYKKLTPHVRNYRKKEIKKLLNAGSYRIIANKGVFPGFDKLSSKVPLIGPLIVMTFRLLEKTPLNRFGISHFIIIQKI